MIDEIDVDGDGTINFEGIHLLRAWRAFSVG